MNQTIFTSNKPHAFDGYNQALNTLCLHDKCTSCGDKTIDVQYRASFDEYLCTECNYNFNEGWIAQYEI